MTVFNFASGSWLFGKVGRGEGFAVDASVIDALDGETSPLDPDRPPKAMKIETLFGEVEYFLSRVRLGLRGLSGALTWNKTLPQ